MMKIGTKVKVVDKKRSNCGVIGTIIETSAEKQLMVIKTEDGRELAFSPEEVESLEHKQDALEKLGFEKFINSDKFSQYYNKKSFLEIAIYYEDGLVGFSAKTVDYQTVLALAEIIKEMEKQKK